MHDIDRIVLVGHCSFDAHSLRHAAARVPGVRRVEVVNEQRGFEAAADGTALLLINRVLDGRFDRDHGVDLIEQLRASGNTSPVMLVSDFPEAQREAEEAGALPGFGKSQVHSPETIEKLAAAVAVL